MPKPHLFCDSRFNQRVWLKVCAARERGLWEAKNEGEEVLLSCLLFTAHMWTVDNGHLGPNWPVLQTINSVLHWQLFVCVVCVSSQSDALRWPSLEPVGGGIGGNGSRLELHQNSQKLRRLKHAVKQPVMPSTGHSFTDSLLQRQWSIVRCEALNVNCNFTRGK